MSSASPPLHPPFTEALATLHYCLLHPAESSDAAMHSNAWIYSEEGFMDDRKWMVLESQIWGLLVQVNQDLLKCSVNIEPIEMESESKSEEVPPSAQSPEPKIPTPLPPEQSPMPTPSPGPENLIPPMLHTPTPEPRSLTPVPPPPKKYKFGPKNINASDEEQASPSKSLHQAPPCPPHLTHEQKQKGHIPATSGSKLCSCPHKIKEKTVAVVCKHGGLGEPILKNAYSLSLEDLCPIGLLVSDQDFRDYVGCQGAFFKRELASKVGHFMSVPCDACSKNQSYVNTLEPVFVPETWCQMNDSDGNIPSLFLANHLDNIKLVSELFEKGVKEGKELADLEAQEAPSKEDPDAEEEEDELQGDK
ncbi:hypothetical protein ARMGADRAFT_1029998 [Armillaria gallica]|uniref:Uncharacterized protein n=1 Tax=Armillaria gallica TaxID=47427 RepID=A0A2H3DYF0_ARMGA|nr:hypothetical protein ARMGADRAFT_1029998 [Armillaria gallica]